MLRPPESDRVWPWVRYFLEEVLPHHRGLSPHTAASYRTAFRHLREYLQERCDPSELARLRLETLQPPLLLGFLGWLEAPGGRGVSASTRNCRLAALRSFFRCLELHRGPEEVARWQRLRRLPFKRAGRGTTDPLELAEIERVLSVVPARTRDGFRDLALLALLYNTGARASEVTGVQRSDLLLEGHPAVRLRGKGRCERLCPLWESTATLLRRCLEGHRRPPRRGAERFVFINQRGGRLTRHGLGRLVGKYLARAAESTPSLRFKRLSPHSFRHATARHLLASGVDLHVVKAWLGHRSVSSTDRYLDLDLEAHRELLDRFTPPRALQLTETDPSSPTSSAEPDDDIAAWLERL